MIFFYDYTTWFLDPLYIPQLYSLQSESSDLKTWDYQPSVRPKKLALCKSLEFHMYVIEVNFVEYDTVILKTLLLQKL
jgi:hypothetical protein